MSVRPLIVRCRVWKMVVQGRYFETGEKLAGRRERA